MRRKLVAAIAAVLMLVAAGCSSVVTSGTISAKTFVPEHNGTWLWCHLVGKITVCQPMPRHYNDRWTFTIKSGDNKADVNVTKEVYDSYQVGDYYSTER